MLYSKDQLWFENVAWEERSINIQCLVDTSDTPIEDGYYVVRSEKGLSVYVAHRLNQKQLNDTDILGKAIRWSVYDK